MTERSTLILIDLSCTAPELVFEAWGHDLPTLALLTSRGINALTYSYVRDNFCTVGSFS
jgi:hypothetical protein